MSDSEPSYQDLRGSVRQRTARLRQAYHSQQTREIASDAGPSSIRRDSNETEDSSIDENQFASSFQRPVQRVEYRAPNTRDLLATAYMNDEDDEEEMGNQMSYERHRPASVARSIQRSIAQSTHHRRVSATRSMAPSDASHGYAQSRAASQYTLPKARSKAPSVYSVPGKARFDEEAEMSDVSRAKTFSDTDEETGAHSEFKMRYTPVECNGEHFAQNYLLRMVEQERSIKVFIVVTMYNEDADELRRTLKGICQSIETFAEIEGEDIWKQIAVCIVSDGRTKVNTDTLTYLNQVGVFNADMIHTALDHSKHIRMHLFENTVFIPNGQVNSSFHPLQTIFALKEHNGGKLDSHFWFFQAFSAQIQPKYCFTVDVGTKPEKRAIWKLYEAMEKEPQCAGCSGEIAPRTQASIVPWIAAQQFEYKIATILDKSMESVFGFISVLPGAFSAYRWNAIEGRPLEQYFKSIRSDLSKISPFKGNMYLAEDRILCFELLAERDNKWVLRYVRGATASTDVPETLTDLIKQRRRWLNGSLFAMVYAIFNFGRFFWHTRHSWIRKSFILGQFAFYSIQLVLTWFLLANLFLMFRFSTEGIVSSGIAEVFYGLFFAVTLIQVIVGLGNKPNEMTLIYFMCCIGYGVFFIATLYFNFQLLASNDIQNQLDSARNSLCRDFNERNQCIVDPNLSSSQVEALQEEIADLENRQTSQDRALFGALGALGTFIASAFLNNELLSVLLSIVQFFFMMPMFMIGFPIYSFCNIHDISWVPKDWNPRNCWKAIKKLEKILNNKLHYLRNDAKI